MHLTAAVVFLFAVVYAGFSDLCSFRIPNWTCLVVLACFFPAAVASGWGMTEMSINLGAGATTLGIGLVLFARGLIGGGDVKLLATISVWTGWGGLPAFLLVVAAFGGVLALALLAFRRLELSEGLSGLAWVGRLHSERRHIPYGVAIAAGAIAVIPRLAVLSPVAAWFAP